MALSLPKFKLDPIAAKQIKPFLSIGCVCLLTGILIGFQAAEAHKTKTPPLDPRNLLIPIPKRWQKWPHLDLGFYILEEDDLTGTVCLFPDAPLMARHLVNLDVIEVGLNDFPTGLLRYFMNPAKGPKAIKASDPLAARYLPCSSRQRVVYEK